MASDGEPDAGAIRNYFVDEAGDANLFGRRKKIIVGQPGCSTYFILGFLDVPDPQTLGADLTALRAALLSDAYLRGIPSMQPQFRKTFFAFHAKDDCPEVRREVFRLLTQHTLRFFAEVRNKHAVVAYAQQQAERNSGYRYRPNELYDSLVSRLFRDHLHKDAGYRICFAKRDKGDRTIAFTQALEKARDNFARKYDIQGEPPISTVLSTPPRSAGLQAVDYFLWALQRCYERGEDRYMEYVWPKVHLVHDIDDRSEKRWGVYYNQSNPLTARRIAAKKSWEI